MIRYNDRKVQNIPKDVRIGMYFLIDGRNIRFATRCDSTDFFVNDGNNENLKMSNQSRLKVICNEELP